ncbi:hypothetical protein [Rhizobium indigoferae]|uniref:Uncharacterized protein n=1 Tax=Rhizobium indigoferae TaxID=158891 RepID=A0ABZ0ZA93_9HYPH|nr:hypothetical protein [Rhizobium indigoferae]NNU57214.1 hypothetical protein [Rhizobium indigoferae]WQN35792.1 hypothetical protein U5G49_000843 [Rhizobium indigoferae]GLR58268.1 hypothetical protein GCM10007919_29940 [Rhizobium indigoferae]
MSGLLDTLEIGVGIAACLPLYYLHVVAIGYPSVARLARAGYVLPVKKARSHSQRGAQP